MIRPDPCIICHAIESSQAYGTDPWCGDTCHKKIAQLLKMDQKNVTAADYKQAKQTVSQKIEFGDSFTSDWVIAQIAKEIKEIVAIRTAREITSRYGYQGAAEAMHFASPAFTNGSRKPV